VNIPKQRQILNM